MSDDRSITDSRVLAAMAHPVRRRLLDLLKLDGPATASTLAQETGEAVGNVSHHLRALAAAGLIEEAPELARDRRERWWRRTTRTLCWSSADFADDAAGEAIARAADSLNLERQAGHIRRWADQPQSEQERWPRGPFSTEAWLRVTDDELAQFADEIRQVMSRWAEREVPDDGRERDTVFAFARAVPGRP
ncbi:helix-turn-helix transcriptional regulator [Microtetraspora sp. AC03309]|uniref:winged helix-turn-helix domain-containing protein n=1 Tax=Microtetraspora sp. AC03309 TaxID=2779376 RepID=UPI001E2B19C9|nr:helix-turn-helix domain-containing protein [Microtetraspora sp. AC03309]MCC5576171.1 helix-turn-helix transcriptional regulator [Microtetraspora sp. AC03309]